MPSGSMDLVVPISKVVGEFEKDPYVEETQICNVVGFISKRSKKKTSTTRKTIDRHHDVQGTTT